jgi:hypothetical protein
MPDNLKATIKQLSLNTDIFSSQATACEAIYKNTVDLKKTSKEGFRDLLTSTEAKITDSIISFAGDIKNVTEALNKLWTMQFEEIANIQENAEIIHQV